MLSRMLRHVLAYASSLAFQHASIKTKALANNYLICLLILNKCTQLIYLVFCYSLASAIAVTYVGVPWHDIS